MTAAERDAYAARDRATRAADASRIDPWFRPLAAMDYECSALHADRAAAESADPAVAQRWTRSAARWRGWAANLA